MVEINKMFKTKNLIKIILSFAIVLCLIEMPYWYYQLFRIFSTIGFVYLAYLDYKSKIKITPQIFISAAIIVNPIFKISFGREVWQVVDMILLVVVIFSIVYEYLITKNYSRDL